MKVFLVACVLAVAAKAASLVYVSPFGSDVASGGSMSNPFLTVSYAIGQVDANGVVYVLTGAYTDFPRIAKNVTISSYPTTMNPSQFVFNAQGRSNYMTISATVTLAGITFTGGGSSNGIVFVDSSGTGTIINCVFKTNANHIMVGGQLTITESSITIDNTLGSSYGISIPYNSGQISRTSLFVHSVNFTGTGNVSNGNYGVSVNDQATITIQESTLFNLGTGFRVSSSFSSNVFTTLTNTFITGCQNGAYFTNLQGGATLRVQGSSFNGNGVTSNGAGLYISGGLRVVMQDTLFSGNSASQRGGAIYCGGTSSLNIANSIFTNNKAADGAAGWCSSSCAFLGTGLSGHGNDQSSNTGACAMP